MKIVNSLYRFVIVSLPKGVQSAAELESQVVELQGLTRGWFRRGVFLALNRELASVRLRSATGFLSAAHVSI